MLQSKGEAWGPHLHVTGLTQSVPHALYRSHGLVAVVGALEAQAWLGARGWTGKSFVRSCGELDAATGVRFVIAEDLKPHTQLPFLLQSQDFLRTHTM